jgi:hypothetical protein
MAVIERRGKKWRALVRLKGHPTAPETFHGRKAAEDWAKATEDALRAGKALPSRGMTLADLIDKYVKEVGRFKPVSATKRGNLKRWSESLGERDVSTLTGQDILDHVAGRMAGPAAPAALRISHVLLGQSRQRLRELRRRDQAGPRRHRHRGIVRTLPAQQLPGQRIGLSTCSEKLKSSSAAAFAVVVILTWKLFVARTHRSTTRALPVLVVALTA